jgi:hypothetical protein
MENDELPELQVGNARLHVRLKCPRASTLLPLDVVELLIEMHFQKHSERTENSSRDSNLPSSDIDFRNRGV